MLHAGWEVRMWSIGMRWEVRMWSIGRLSAMCEMGHVRRLQVCIGQIGEFLSSSAKLCATVYVTLKKVPLSVELICK